MAYRDFQDFPRKTASDKELRDEALLLKMKNMMHTSLHLLQWSTKRFEKCFLTKERKLVLKCNK